MKLFVAARSYLPKQGWGPIGCLDMSDGYFRFRYTHGARETAGFNGLTGMGDLDEVYLSKELFPVFANRIMSARRPEYEDYLRWSGFDPKQPPDPLTLLAVTEGIRQTDNIELFPQPSPNSEGRYINRFFLHGIQWMPKPAFARIARLAPGEILRIMFDPCNPFDTHAVAFRTDDPERYVIGYAPRYLARDFTEVVNKCSPDWINVIVHSLNLDAPLQQRVLCQLNACWPPEFVPCSGRAYQAIVEDQQQISQAVSA